METCPLCGESEYRRRDGSFYRHGPNLDCEGPTAPAADDFGPEPVVYQLTGREARSLSDELLGAGSLRVMIDSDGVKFSVDGGRWSPPMGVRQ